MQATLPLQQMLFRMESGSPNSMGTTAQGHVMISEALLSPLPPEILIGGLRIATLEKAEESSHFKDRS